MNSPTLHPKFWSDLAALIFPTTCFFGLVLAIAPERKDPGQRKGRGEMPSK